MDIMPYEMMIIHFIELVTRYSTKLKQINNRWNNSCLLFINGILAILDYFHQPSTGPYGQIPSTIFIGGKSVNLEMIHASLAEVYRGKPPKGFGLRPYLQAESDGKASKKGMRVLGDDYVSPKDWRTIWHGDSSGRNSALRAG